jgi:hypothetical protein
VSPDSTNGNGGSRCLHTLGSGSLCQVRLHEVSPMTNAKCAQEGPWALVCPGSPSPLPHTGSPSLGYTHTFFFCGTGA